MLNWCGEGSFSFGTYCFHLSVTYIVPSVYLFFLCVYRAYTSINYLFRPKYERIPLSFYLSTICLATTPLIQLAIIAVFSLHSIGYSNILCDLLVSLSWTISTFLLSSDSRGARFPSQALLIFYSLEFLSHLLSALSPAVPASLSTVILCISILELVCLGLLTGYGFYLRETMSDDVNSEDDDEFSIQQSREEANWQDFTSLCFPMVQLRFSSSSSKNKGSYSSLTNGDNAPLMDEDEEGRSSSSSYRHHFGASSSSASSMSDLGSVDASTVRRSSHVNVTLAANSASNPGQLVVKQIQPSLLPSGAIVASYGVILTLLSDKMKDNDDVFEIAVRREQSSESEWYGNSSLKPQLRDQEDENGSDYVWKVSRSESDFHQLHIDLKNHFGVNFNIREPVIKSVYSLTDYLRDVLRRREFYCAILNVFLNVIPTRPILSPLSPDSSDDVGPLGMSPSLMEQPEILVLPPTALLQTQSSVYSDEDLTSPLSTELSSGKKDEILKIFGQLKRQLSESTCVIHFRTFHNVLRANEIIKAIKLIPSVQSPLTAAQDLVSYQLLLPVCCGYSDDDADNSRPSSYCDDVDPTLISTFQQGHEWLYCYGDYRRISSTPLTRVAMTLFEHDISVQIPVFTQKTIQEADGSTKIVNVYQVLVSVLDSTSSSSSMAYSLPAHTSGGMSPPTQASSSSFLLSSFSSQIEAEPQNSILSSSVSEYGDDFILTAGGLDGEVSSKTSIVSTDSRNFDAIQTRSTTMIPSHGNALDTWDCYRRFSEFVVLDKFIKYRKVRLPKQLPTKNLLRLGTEAQLNARRRGLEEYIQGVVRVARENSLIAPAVAVFLDSFAERLRVRVLDSLALYFREKEAQKEQMAELEESMGV